MNHELKIGLLVPQSKQYPSLDKDFVRGIKLSGLEGKYFVESIGLAADDKEITDKIQKLTLQEDVQVIIGFFGHRNIEAVYKYAEAQNVLLIASDLGATIPFSLGKRQGVYVNSLGLTESTFLLGQYLSKEKKYRSIATSSSYYDVGYGMQSALEMSLYANDSQFSGHYITPFYPRADEATLMVQTIEPLEPEAVFACHSGLYAEEHASFIETNKLTAKYPYYMTPFAVSSKIVKQYGELFADTHVVGSWIEGLDTEANLAFCELYENTHGNSPTVFSLLGYENGLIVNSALEAAGGQIHFGALTKAIDGNVVQGPRGEIRFDPETNRAVYNHYVCKLVIDSDANKALEQVAILENDGQFIKDIIQKDFPEQSGGWHNAYLCH